MVVAQNGVERIVVRVEDNRRCLINDSIIKYLHAFNEGCVQDLGVCGLCWKCEKRATSRKFREGFLVGASRDLLR